MSDQPISSTDTPAQLAAQDYWNRLGELWLQARNLEKEALAAGYDAAAGALSQATLDITFASCAMHALMPTTTTGLTTEQLAEGHQTAERA